MARLLSVMLSIVAALFITLGHTSKAFEFGPDQGFSGPETCPTTHPDYPTCTASTNCASRATAKLIVSPSTIVQGQSATISWAVTLAARCPRLEPTLNGQRVALQGSVRVTPLANQTYVLKLASVTLGTKSLPVELPSTVRIAGNTIEWKQLLVQALSSPTTQVVLLASHVNMDLTGFFNIRIREGMTLTAEPPIRDARHLGPRLFTRGHAHPLFAIKCYGDNKGDNVRILGFRLQGPKLDTEEDENTFPRGISIDSCRGIEIANMELSGWSGQAIYLRHSDDQTRTSAVWIHDNFIHHNQHKGTNGYGVDVSDGAFALIERNVFDFNRHGIAASSAARTRYWAVHNLVLAGGGVHDGILNHYTHQFDVHGDDHCSPTEDIPVIGGIDIPGFDDVPFHDEGWFNCGNAGESFRILSNAFQYRRDDAVKLRGKPRGATYINRNVFPHPTLKHAVKLASHTNVSVSANIVDVDTYGQYGVCDFDADGRDDLFLATGASWWYSSAGQMHWVFLNTHTERLHQVGLGDFDGDRRCDVFAVRDGRWKISSGGVSSWASLPGGYSTPFAQLGFGDFNGDGTSDVFRRSVDGQWSAVLLGQPDRTEPELVELAGSPLPLNALRFGDFDGDSVTDVLAFDGRVPSIFWSGRGTGVEQPVSLSGDPASFLIADVDGIRGDDLVRYVVTTRGGRWEVSSSARTSWQLIASLGSDEQEARLMRSFVGQSDRSPGADLLAADPQRLGRILSSGRQVFAAHGRYAY
jgi:hypothetical protein